MPAAISYPALIPPGTLDQPVGGGDKDEDEDGDGDVEEGEDGDGDGVSHALDGSGKYVKDLGNNCFHFPKHQISSLSLVPTILALVDRIDEPVERSPSTKFVLLYIEELFLFWTYNF